MSTRPTIAIALLFSVVGACSTPVPASVTPTATASGEAAYPAAIRPDEPWIAYNGWEAGGTRGGVWLSRPDGTGQHLLDPGIPGGQDHPDWSPDGSQIVFRKTVDEADEAIWIMGSDGSGAHEIVPAQPGCCGQDHPYWSPDGTSIAFARWVGPETSATSQIEVYDIAQRSLRVVATAKMPTVLDQPHWSPDSKTLVVEVDKFLADGSCCAADGAIALIPVATGELRILTDAVPFPGAPAWRPDGEAIVFDSLGLSYYESTTPEQATNLYLISIDGSGLIQLTHNAAGGKRATEPFWLSNDTIGYVEAEAQRSLDRFVRFVSADGLQLADPATTIYATHPQCHRGM